MKALLRILVSKRTILVFLPLLFTTSVVIANIAGAKNSAPHPDLVNAVTNLKLGLGNYIIGTSLTEVQVTSAKSKLEEDAYEGTYKFKDNNVFVVADRSSNMILAVYTRQEDVDREQMKKIIGMLMTSFGEPTTMAHDKLIYWAYKKEGKISEDAYLKSKDTGSLDVVATVKMNSTIEIFADENSTETKEPSESKVKDQPLGRVYTLITSQPLLEHFLSQH